MKSIGKKKIYTFSVVIERDEDGMYIGSVPALRGCYTQGKTLPQLYERLEEVVALCLEVEREYFSSSPQQNELVGVQALQFAV